MRTLPWLLAALVALSPLASAQAQLPAPESGPFYRFLILVDSSTGMKRRREATAKSIAELIHSGFGGRAQKGDAIGLWTFGKEVDAAAFSAMKWSEPLRPALTAQATRFVMERRYAGKSNLDRAMQAILMATRTSKEVTVFIFSDGNEVLYGTPYDLDISTVYILHREELKTSKSPFITSLAARDGRIQAWAVDSGGGTVTIPQIKDEKPPTPRKPEDKTLAAKEPSPPGEAKEAIRKPPPKKPSRPKPRVVQSIELPTEPPRKPVPAPRKPQTAAPETSKPTPAPKEAASRTKTPSPAPTPGNTQNSDAVAAASPKQSWPPKTVTPWKAPAPQPNTPQSAAPTAKPDAKPTPSPDAQSTAQPTKPAIQTLAAAKSTPPDQPLDAKTAPEPEPAPAARTAPDSTATTPKPPTSSPPENTPPAAKQPPAETSPAGTSTPPSPAPNPAPTPAALATPMEDPGSPTRFIFMSLALLLTAGIIAYVALRKSRTSSHASIISQSLDRERE